MKLRRMTAVSFLEEIEYFVELVVFTRVNFVSVETTLEYKTSYSYARDNVVSLIKGFEVYNGVMLRGDISQDDYEELKSIFPELPDFSWIYSVKFGHRSLSEVKLL